MVVNQLRHTDIDYMAMRLEDCADEREGKYPITDLTMREGAAALRSSRCLIIELEDALLGMLEDIDRDGMEIVEGTYSRARTAISPKSDVGQ